MRGVKCQNSIISLKILNFTDRFKFKTIVTLLDLLLSNILATIQNLKIMKYSIAFNLLLPLSSDLDKLKDGKSCSFEYFKKSKSFL